jgi:hypothetical protein
VYHQLNLPDSIHLGELYRMNGMNLAERRNAESKTCRNKKPSKVVLMQLQRTLPLTVRE